MNIYEEVLRLDKRRCQAWGCGKTTNLEIHHIIPRGQERGINKEWTLITLCDKHHNQITGNKVTDIELLTPLKRKRNFRWQKALNWHIKRFRVKEAIKEVQDKCRG